ncbi:hypothetical protein KC345_g278 [Hortaea werneckii]|nr:hypothetical protein KC345_g278 [Hortaea werneckii]
MTDAECVFQGILIEHTAFIALSPTIVRVVASSGRVDDELLLSLYDLPYGVFSQGFDGTLNSCRSVTLLSTVHGVPATIDVVQSRLVAKIRPVNGKLVIELDSRTYILWLTAGQAKVHSMSKIDKQNIMLDGLTGAHKSVE